MQKGVNFFNPKIYF